MTNTILIVDKDDNTKHMLYTALVKEGYSVTLSSCIEDGLEKIEKGEFDYILCDIEEPEFKGLELLRRIKANKVCASTIIVLSNIDTADIEVKALRLGAYDYISKPFNTDEIIFVLKKAEEKKILQRENRLLREELNKEYNFAHIVTDSPTMQKIFETVKKVSRFSSTVLIIGESGTGKELIARAIHNNSNRVNKPFIAVNCSAIPDNLLESEFFGHMKGSFTDASENKKGLFEEADGGTIFLDEIGELKIDLQAKLLRVIQEREVMRVGSRKSIPVDIRILAATAKDLADEVKNQKFREDLYYRLNVVTITLPPLRDRMEDLPLLVDHFIDKYKKELNSKIKGIHPNALTCLKNYYWKGNIRELENIIERTIILSSGDIIKKIDLPDHIIEPEKYIEKAVKSEIFSIKKAVKKVEKGIIAAALNRTGQNKAQAAKLLELSYRTLMYKIKEYGL